MTMLYPLLRKRTTNSSLHTICMSLLNILTFHAISEFGPSLQLEISKLLYKLDSTTQSYEWIIKTKHGIRLFCYFVEYQTKSKNMKT